MLWSVSACLCVQVVECVHWPDPGLSAEAQCRHGGLEGEEKWVLKGQWKLSFQKWVLCTGEL
jgi:hypothetical protein